MDSTLANKLLFAQLNSGRSVEITVTGVSMTPTFFEGDRITVERQNDYSPGDIVVFVYKHDELIVHRLLKVNTGRYYCKGDNSFRLEDMSKEQIAGKVTHLNGNEITMCSPVLIRLSHLVNRAFRSNKYNSDLTKLSGIYRFYHNYMYQKGTTNMKYKKNDTMDYIQSDETTLAVFDSDTGDTHLFDETGIDILECLNQACDMEELLDKLCQIYSVAKEDIRKDVENFINETVSKKVVEVICE